MSMKLTELAGALGAVSLVLGAQVAPGDVILPDSQTFREKFGPRGVIHLGECGRYAAHRGHGAPRQHRRA